MSVFQTGPQSFRWRELLSRSKKNPKDYLALALDNVQTTDEISRLVDATVSSVGVYKVGLEQYVRFGPIIFELVRNKGASIFLDLKLHDIPNTVSKAVGAAAGHEVDFLTVHTSGGRHMLEAAAEAAAKCSRPPKLLGVTVLTSIDADIMRSDLLLDMPPSLYVRHLADLGKRCGLDGIVCSADDLSVLKDVLGSSMEIVTPGIRRSCDSTGDQKRCATPTTAIKNGATMLVIGRPISLAEDPGFAAADFHAEISRALTLDDDADD